MDNQHKHIKGYRDLTSEEIEAMNDLKALEEKLCKVMNSLDLWTKSENDPAAGRWASIARTHLETGFMYAIKAIARPTNGLGQKGNG